MVSQTTDGTTGLRETILDAIDRSERGKWSIKIKTLLAQFGFVAVQRVRQSSLLTVLETLSQWDIEYRYRGDSANDYITLSRAAQEPSARMPTEVTPPGEMAPSVASFSAPSPLGLLFDIGTRDSASASLDIQNAVWSFQPVCLFVEAGDEFSSFLCGFFSAIMRRRSLMVRHGAFDQWMPLAPSMLDVEHLKGLLRLGGAMDSSHSFPESGAVYILRDSPEDVEDDDIVALARECFIPHTHRIRARYATTSGEARQGSRAAEAPGFAEVLAWLGAFAGGLAVAMPTLEQPVDLASLFAEACQTRDALLQRQALRPIDGAFRAGFESTEHMVLKSALLNWLRLSQFENIAVEELMGPSIDDGEDAEPVSVDSAKREKPDLRAGTRLWIEIETLRGLSLRGSSPFLVLESKLRRKANGMRGVEEVWIIVPNDVALLAGENLRALTHNLNTAIGEDKVRFGFVDIVAERPVLIAGGTPVLQTDSRLSGISWRRRKTSVDGPPPTWDDIAGYSDLKERLREDLLDPLLEPEKYSKHGVCAANGLLLYGLPGCGKSLMGRVLAGESGLLCKVVAPSDTTSMWLGEGVAKIRALFDWALKQTPCVLVLDELDAVAPQRREADMHTDEKRQVNELLAQLDRISGKGVVVVATTNYLRGIDTAIQRSGRFDLKLPVFPPDVTDRAKIFEYYLSPARLTEFGNTSRIDTMRLAEESVLFTPADIKTVVQAAARQAIRETYPGRPSLSNDSLSHAVRRHPRSLRSIMCSDWVAEVGEELGRDDKGLAWLEQEIGRAFP
jgi:AAA+ superfamily predicted ATPase